MEKSIKRQTYVYFAQSLGTSEWTILRRHILQITIGPVVVVGTMGVAYAHLTGKVG
jgi:ABC-type dipeptide/oligopeptide/nickel transport system permease subunit